MADHPTLVITDLYAFIAVHEDGEEGVCGFRLPDGSWIAMVGADWKRVEILRPMAKQIAIESGKPIKLVRFSARTEVETIAAQTYRIEGDRITCLICGRTSAHPQDVENRYCGHCHVFHQED